MVGSVNLCQCGCGGATGFAKQTETRKGIRKGDPFRFLPNHYKGQAHHAWKNGVGKTSSGYTMILMPGHPRADGRGYVLEHLLVAEKALGRPIESNHQVHHINKIKSDNRNENLVICENSSYHHLLHQRMSAIAAGCPATWLKCPYCKKFDAPENLWIESNNRGKHHRECVNARHREVYKRSKRVGSAK